LRFTLHATPVGVVEAITELPGVIAAVERDGRLEVIVGTRAPAVYQRIAAALDFDDRQVDPAGADGGVVSRSIAAIVAVFAPFIYLLAAAAIARGILEVAGVVWPQASESPAWNWLVNVVWAPFILLPVLIAVGASRRFGSNVYVAAAMGAAVVGVQWLQMLRVSGSGESLPTDSALPSGFWIGIVPLIFMFWVLSRLERWLDGRLNDRIRLVAKPVICLFVFFPVAYVVMVLVSSGLSFAALSFAQSVLSPLWIDVPVAYAAFAGLLWPILSAFGLEIMLFPMHDFLALGGPDNWWAFAALAAAIMGQAGAAMGVLVRSRNRDLRRLAGVSVLAGLAGEVVPAMYGVTLRLKIPFVIGCIAGSAGAVVMVTSGALPELSAQILQISNPEGSASGSIPGLLSLAGSAEGTTALLGLSLGMLVSFVAAFVLVAAFGFKDPQGDLRTNTSSSTTVRQPTQTAYDDL
jgi:PTS system beta-glucosides-specific IIC component